MHKIPRYCLRSAVVALILWTVDFYRLLVPVDIPSLPNLYRFLAAFDVSQPLPLWPSSALLDLLPPAQSALFADAGILGLTKFMRTRKAVGNNPSSWWKAVPGVSVRNKLGLPGQLETSRGSASARYNRSSSSSTSSGSGVVESATGAQDDNNSGLELGAHSKSKHKRLDKISKKGRSSGDEDEHGHHHRPQPYQADHVCVDMNQILHGSFRTSSDPSHCMAKIFLGLDTLLKFVEPMKSLVLTFDGPAPFAKIQTQRKRRMTSPENSLITPGTDFMNAMTDVMVCYVLQRAKRPLFQNITVYISGADQPGEGELKIVDWLHTHLPLTVNSSAYLSQSASGGSAVTVCPSVISNVPDSEGSVTPSTGSGTSGTGGTTGASVPNRLARKINTDSVVICGSDSDILLQAITLSYKIPNIAVLQSGSDYPDAFCNISRLVDEVVHLTGLSRDKAGLSASAVASAAVGTDDKTATSSSITGAGSGAGTVLSVGVDEDGDEVSAAALASASETTAPTGVNATAPPSSMLYPDLVTLFALQGNDYLPKLRGISMTKALKLYGQTMQLLPKNKRFLMDTQKKSFNFLALYHLMRLLKRQGDSKFQLSDSIPTALQTLHTVLQKRKIKDPLRWVDIQMIVDGDTGVVLDRIVHNNEDPATAATAATATATATTTTSNSTNADDASTSESPLSATPTTSPAAPASTTTSPSSSSSSPSSAPLANMKTLWCAQCIIEGQTYSFTDDRKFPSKRTARGELSGKILRELDPQAYEEMIVERDRVLQKIADIKRVAGSSVEFTVGAGGDSESYVGGGGDADSIDVGSSGVTSKDEVDEEAEEDEEDYDGDDGGSDNNAPSPQSSSPYHVSEEEYARYVGDTDVEEYLRGLVWVAQMYVDGVCPDYSYTFNSKTAPTAGLILNYIERHMLNEGRHFEVSSSADGATAITAVATASISAGASASASSSATKNMYEGAAGFRKLQRDTILALEVANGLNTTITTTTTAGTTTDGTSTTTGLFSNINVTSTGSDLDDKKVKVYKDALHDIYSRVTISKAPIKPLSASATSVCVIPPQGEYFVPRHLRTVWRRLQATFFTEMVDATLTDASYASLTNQLREVWKEGRISKIDDVVTKQMQLAQSQGTDPENSNINSVAQGASTVTATATSGRPTKEKKAAPTVDTEKVIRNDVQSILPGIVIGPELNQSFSFDALPSEWKKYRTGLGKRRNQRRKSRQKRKEKGREKAYSQLSNMFSMPDNYGSSTEVEEGDFSDGSVGHRYIEGTCGAVEYSSDVGSDGVGVRGSGSTTRGVSAAGSSTTDALSESDGDDDYDDDEDEEEEDDDGDATYIDDYADDYDDYLDEDDDDDLESFGKSRFVLDYHIEDGSMKMAEGDSTSTGGTTSAASASASASAVSGRATSGDATTKPGTDGVRTARPDGLLTYNASEIGTDKAVLAGAGGARNKTNKNPPRPMGPLFVRDGDCEWTIITTTAVLQDPTRTIPPHRSVKLKLPLPLPFHTPRRLPEGFRVLKAPHSGLQPIRKLQSEIQTSSQKLTLNPTKFRIAMSTLGRNRVFLSNGTDVNATTTAAGAGAVAGVPTRDINSGNGGGASVKANNKGGSSGGGSKDVKKPPAKPAAPAAGTSSSTDVDLVIKSDDSNDAEGAAAAATQSNGNNGSADQNKDRAVASTKNGFSRPPKTPDGNSKNKNKSKKKPKPSKGR